MPQHHNEFRNHVFSTYHTLRVGMAIMAGTFPLGLALGGLFMDIAFHDSMSAYYWATPTPKLCASLGQYAFPTEFLPLRRWFVGLLFVLGTVL